MNHRQLEDTEVALKEISTKVREGMRMIAVGSFVSGTFFGIAIMGFVMSMGWIK